MTTSQTGIGVSLLALVLWPSAASAQEPLQFNVPYHCPDGTDNIITRCASNARGEVCSWREEKNGQLIVERFNIRSQMDGWLKICKVQSKASAAKAAAPATQPPQSGQALNPPYLSGMPSVDLVKREIQGKDPTDTLARQVAVFNLLPEVIQRFQLADRSRYDLTPDEQKVTGQYNLAAYELEQGYKKTHTPAEAQEFFRLHGRYELDQALDREMYTKLFSSAFMAEYGKINKSINQWYQAHLDRERRESEDARAQAKGTQGNTTFIRNDPGTLAARRCVELGGDDLECVGKGLSTGFMAMLGLETVGAITKPTRTGLVMTGQYNGANGVRLTFGDDRVTLAGCGQLVDNSLAYTLAKRGLALLVQLAIDPKPITAVLGPDGNISGPGLTDVQGQIITGYRRYTEYERRVSDNTIVPGSEHLVSVPIYGPKLERCGIGALRSTGPVVSDSLLNTLLAAASGDPSGSKLKTTPAGPRMSGSYESSGGMKIQFATEGAVLDCGEAHVARPYTVENAASAVRVLIDNGGVPLALTLQPDGTLAGAGTAEVAGRVVSGSTPNGIAFAPRNTRCPVGVLAPHGARKP
jgi:hypothetical protein